MKEKMKKVLMMLAMLLLLVASAVAQSVRKEIEENIRLSAANHLAYPTPDTKKLQAAPDGKKPFYISHYGRHGSRYLIGRDEYEEPYKVLAAAEKAGVLTDLGREVMEKIRILKEEAAGRYGELSPLGARQHREIAKRMYERFPEVFADDSEIDAKSTIVIRCILSMTNAINQLTALNPKLKVRCDASNHDMYYMNFDDKVTKEKTKTAEAKRAYEDYCALYPTHERLVHALFSDSVYVSEKVDAVRFYDRLFKLASTIQNMESRTKVTMYDLFTDEELYLNWKKGNARWYMGYASCPLTGGDQPFVQRRLLRKIIEEADSCIALDHPGATLRYGHETMVLPLTCLLGINGYDKSIDNLDNLEKSGWVNYRIFPMGANIQFVFYRKDASDDDVIVRVLLNENEATLPVKTNIAPFYHWKDVREYYLDKLDTFRE